MVPYKERYVDPADGLTKLRTAEREWSDDHDWTALSRQESEYKTQSAQFQSQRQSLWSYFMTHIDDEVDNEIKVHQSYAVAHQAFDTSTLWIILRQAALTHGSKHSGIRHQWSNYKQSTYDSAGNVLSTIPMAKYLLRFQGFLDQMKGHPEQPTDAEASDMLLNGINCVRSSLVWHKYQSANPKPSYATLKNELVTTEKCLPSLPTSDTPTAQVATLVSVSPPEPSVSVSKVFPIDYNPPLTPIQPLQCSMCGAPKASHPGGCPKYGLTCTGCGNIGHGLLFCRKVMKLMSDKSSTSSPNRNNRNNRNRNNDNNDKKKRKVDESISDDEKKPSKKANITMQGYDTDMDLHVYMSGQFPSSESSAPDLPPAESSSSASTPAISSSQVLKDETNAYINALSGPSKATRCVFDSGANRLLFNDLTWLDDTNSQPSTPTSTFIYGIAGSVKATHQCIIGHQAAFICPSAKDNIMSIGWLSQFPSIATTYSSVDNSFRISFGNTTFTIGMTSDQLYFLTKDQVKQLLTHVNNVTNSTKSVNLCTAYSKEQIARAQEVRRLHYALLHPSDSVLIKALKYGLLLGTRLTAQDVYIYRLVYGACPCCLAGKTISPSYKESLSPPALMPGHVVHVDLIPFTEICLGGIQYHLLVCDEFSTYLHSIAMKTKSNSDIILSFTTMISYFKQYGYDIKNIHSDHESALMSATIFLNQQGIQYHTIAPYQHEQKLERYVQTINSRFRSVLSSLKFKLPTKLYAQLFTAVLQFINLMPNSVHPTLTPAIIFKGSKLDIQTQHPVPFGTYAALHYAQRSSNKYEPHTDNGILLYLADSSTANMIAWIPGRHTIVTINKYTIIKASPSDFGFEPNNNIIPSHIPDFIPLPSQSQEGATSLPPQEGANPLAEIPPTASIPIPTIEDNVTLNDTPDNLLIVSEDVPYLRRSTRNLRFHQPIDATVLKATSGISVQRALQINEKKTITAVMNEVKNMLDYKVGHYVHQFDLTYDQKKNILRSFMFIKQKFFPNGDMDKLKARLVADGSQQGRHLYDFVSSATVSLQVVFLLINVASHYKCMLQTVDIRGAFLNAEFTPADKPIYLKINKDVVPYWILQDPTAKPYVSDKGELLLLLDRFLYGLKQSPLKFQLHLTQTLVTAGYKQSLNDECLFYKLKGTKFSYVSTHSDDLLHCVNCDLFAQAFKNILIQTYKDIEYHDQASSYIGMSINRSSDLSTIYISQRGLTQRIISDFLPDDFPVAASPASSHLFNHEPEDKPYDRILFLSIIMAIMYLARLSRPDVLLATAFLATKAQNPTEGHHRAALRIISYLKATITHGIKINCQELRFHLHCDASWASHHDGSSHTGWILKMGESFLGSKSSKQRVGSPSSTDAEIISTVDGLKNLKWLDNLTVEIGLSLSICHLYQDNLSASKIIMKTTKTKQVKHLLCKINLAQQYFADKLYDIIQTPTEDMIADALTKPKAPYNYASVEANRLGVYTLPLS